MPPRQRTLNIRDSCGEREESTNCSVNQAIQVEEAKQRENEVTYDKRQFLEPMSFLGKGAPGR